MRDLGLIKNDEPVERLFTQGMVIKNGAKMSKSKGNVVSPDDMIARYGADATRMYSLFAAPPDRDLDWQEDGVAGVSRFLGRVYRFVMKAASGIRQPIAANGNQLHPAIAPILERKLHQTIHKITQDFAGRWHFNTCIAAIMELLNLLVEHEDAIVSSVESDVRARELMTNLVLLLSPFAPYLAAELWDQLGGTSVINKAPWPKSDPGKMAELTIEVPVQVNKAASRSRVPADVDRKTLQEAIMADARCRQPSRISKSSRSSSCPASYQHRCEGLMTAKATANKTSGAVARSHFGVLVASSLLAESLGVGSSAHQRSFCSATKARASPAAASGSKPQASAVLQDPMRSAVIVVDAIILQPPALHIAAWLLPLLYGWSIVSGIGAIS